MACCTCWPSHGRPRCTERTPHSPPQHTHACAHWHCTDSACVGGVQVELALEDFNHIAASIPILGNLAPGGAYHMTDLDRVGGVTALMKELLQVRAGFGGGHVYDTDMVVAGGAAERRRPHSQRAHSRREPRGVCRQVGVAAYGCVRT